MSSPELLIDYLQNNTALITFQKKNGDIRELEATLVDYLLPEVRHERKCSNDNIILVYDLENEGWRSFDFRSLIHVEKLNV